jgi:hypothetical protein
MRQRDWLLIVGAVLVALAVPAAIVIAPMVRLEQYGLSVRLRSPILYEVRDALPPGDQFSAINKVQKWPSDWAAAVCAPPVYEVRVPYKELPNATAVAACSARVQPRGQVTNVMMARFPTELAMQVDLANEGSQWYAFTFVDGGMLAFASSVDDSTADPEVSVGNAVLRPLRQFGFNIYSTPGPP